jgi:hypothetical protein
MTSGARWWTVGVSDNIIDASFQALMDSIVFKLMKNRGNGGAGGGGVGDQVQRRSHIPSPE